MRQQSVFKNVESVGRITNRALGGRATTLRIGHFYHFSGPVSTDGKDIQLNTVFPNSHKLSLKEKIAIWKGLNYHALGHILFTENSVNLQGKEREAFDFLEDGRVEWLMSYIYPGTRKYFVNNLMKMGLNDPLVMWSRRHLFPPKVRIHESFESYRDVPPRALDIVDAFIRSKTLAEREDLAREFASVASLSDKSRRLLGDIEKLGRAHVETVRLDDGLQSDVQEAIEEFQKRTEDEERSADDTDAYGSLEDAAEDEEVKKDLEDAADTEVDERKHSEYGATEIIEHKVKPDPVLVRQLYQIFNRTRISMGSYYEKKLLAGRVDPREAMKYAWMGNPRIFKRFEEDRLDEAKLALALVLDKSGSMQHSDPEGITKKAGCALARAATKAGFEVMVVGFDTRSHVIKAAREKGFRDYKFGGGTAPIRALLHAETFLNESTHTPILVLLSDGQFDQAAHRKLGQIAKRLRSVYVIALGWRFDQWEAANIKPRPVETVGEVTKVIADIIEEEEQRKVREFGRAW